MAAPPDHDQGPLTYPVQRRCPLDPPDELLALRDTAGTHRLRYPDGSVGWLATGYDEARAALSSASMSARNDLHRTPVPTATHSSTPPAPGMFNKMDPPEHTRYRKALAGFFTVRRIAAFAPVIEEVVAEHVDRLIAAGPGADLVEHVAEPVPSVVICRFVGVPERVRTRITGHMKTVSRYSTPAKQATWAMRGLFGHVQRLVAAAVAGDGEPGVLSDLATTGDLSTEELTYLTSVLLIGGHDTAASMLGLGTFALLEHPEQLELLRSEPDRLDNAVEELLRYLTISHLGAARTALETGEVGGTTVPAGETVTVALAAANRDPVRFPDPDRLDITRRTQGHVAFGYGVHQCIGQHFARQILRHGFAALIDRPAGLRLAVDPSEIPMNTDMIHYGPAELPVTWAGDR